MSPAESNTASVRSSISRKKLAANRRNAAKSTGPRTDAGKGRSSRNALTHGIFCADLVIGDEQRPLLMALREAVHRSLGVGGDVIEIGYADAIVAARWKLRRVQAAECDLHDYTVERTRRFRRRRLERLDRRIERQVQNEAYDPSDEARIRAEHADERARCEAALALPDGPASATLAANFRHSGGGAWERLTRYEQRLEQSIARAMRELHAYRKELREFGPPEPIEDDEEDQADEDGEAKAQNEPTETDSAASDGAAEGCNASSSSMGVPPMSSSTKECMGETPMLRKEEESRGESPPKRSD